MCWGHSASTSMRNAHHWSKQCQYTSTITFLRLLWLGLMDRTDEFHDSRTVWQRVRDIAGTALGPRSRLLLLQRHGGTTFEAHKVDTPKSSPGTTAYKGPTDDLRRALLRQRNFKPHHQEQRCGKFWPAFVLWTTLYNSNAVLS